MGENAPVLGQNAGDRTANHLHSRTSLGTAGPGLSEALTGLSQPEALALEAGTVQPEQSLQQRPQPAGGWKGQLGL